MRTTVSIAICLLIVPPIFADVAPTAGYKRVTVSHIVETEKDFSDYRFYRVKFSRFGPWGVKTPPGGEFKLCSPVEISPGSWLWITGSRRDSFGLIAVPAGTQTDHIKMEDMWDAARNGQIPGAYRSVRSFGFDGDLPDSDSRSSKIVRWRLERINAEEGIVLTRIIEFNELLQPAALLGWMCGLFASSAIILAGFWLVRRSRGERPVVNGIADNFLAGMPMFAHKGRPIANLTEDPTETTQ